MGSAPSSEATGLLPVKQSGAPRHPEHGHVSPQAQHSPLTTSCWRWQVPALLLRDDHLIVVVATTRVLASESL